MRRLFSLPLPCLGLLFIVAACSPSEHPRLPDVTLSGIPNLPQEGPSFEPRYASNQLCAPVAVSNSLVWLEGLPTDRNTQVSLVNKLAHHHYMATSPNLGTSPAGVLHGVEKYLRDAEHSEYTLQYAGWRSVPENYRVATAPSLEWLHAGLSQESAVWLNFGWYEKVMPGVYRRLGGHWVTLVGIVNGELLVHDPGQPQPMRITVEQRAVDLLGNDQLGWRLVPRVLGIETASNPFAEGYSRIDGAIQLSANSEPERE